MITITETVGGFLLIDRRYGNKLAIVSNDVLKFSETMSDYSESFQFLASQGYEWWFINILTIDSLYLMFGESYWGRVKFLGLKCRVVRHTFSNDSLGWVQHSNVPYESAKSSKKGE